MWQSPASRDMLWEYLDGSWDEPLAESAAILCWPDGTTLALAIACPHQGSKDAEFSAFTQCTRYLHSVAFRGSVFFCIDNSQLVCCVDHVVSNTPLPSGSSSTQGTWQTVLDGPINVMAFNIEAGWLKSHVGFTGNELADSFAKYTSYACIVATSYLPPPHLE